MAFADTAPHQPGQEVFLRRPANIYAKVVSQRDPHSGMNDQPLQYAVQLLPLVQYYLHEEMEVSQRPEELQTPPVEAATAPPDQPLPELASDTVAAGHAAESVFTAECRFNLNPEIKDLIARRAYEFYEGRGRKHGHDEEDWNRAVSEVFLNVPVEIVESETNIIIRAQVSDFKENEVEVRVTPRSVCIAGERSAESPTSGETPIDSTDPASRIFRVVELNCEIDPQRVEATLGSGILEVNLIKVGMRKLVPVRARFATA